MKVTIKKLLPRNRFARSVSILAGGTAAGQVITEGDKGDALNIFIFNKQAGPRQGNDMVNRS